MLSRMIKEMNIRNVDYLKIDFTLKQIVLFHQFKSQNLKVKFKIFSDTLSRRMPNTYTKSDEVIISAKGIQSFYSD